MYTMYVFQTILVMPIFVYQVVHSESWIKETIGRNVAKNITNIQARFLVSVGQPWNDCNATTATVYLKAGQNFSTAPDIEVGKCDHGPLFYQIKQGPSTKQMTVTVTFGTHSFSASPPTSSFQWKGGYEYPTKENMKRSPLPGCFLNESDEGYHPTNFLFHLFMWQWF